MSCSNCHVMYVFSEPYPLESKVFPCSGCGTILRVQGIKEQLQALDGKRVTIRPPEEWPRFSEGQLLISLDAAGQLEMCCLRAHYPAELQPVELSRIKRIQGNVITMYTIEELYPDFFKSPPKTRRPFVRLWARRRGDRHHSL